MPLIDRIYATLRDGNRITSRGIARKYRVSAHSVRARISELRSYGWTVNVTRTNRGTRAYSLQA